MPRAHHRHLRHTVLSRSKQQSAFLEQTQAVRTRYWSATENLSYLLGCLTTQEANMEPLHCNSADSLPHSSPRPSAEQKQPLGPADTAPAPRSPQVSPPAPFPAKSPKRWARSGVKRRPTTPRPRPEAHGEGCPATSRGLYRRTAAPGAASPQGQVAAAGPGSERRNGAVRGPVTHRVSPERRRGGGGGELPAGSGAAQPPSSGGVGSGGAGEGRTADSRVEFVVHRRSLPPPPSTSATSAPPSPPSKASRRFRRRGHSRPALPPGAISREHGGRSRGGRENTRARSPSWMRTPEGRPPTAGQPPSWEWRAGQSHHVGRGLRRETPWGEAWRWAVASHSVGVTRRDAASGFK